MQVMDQSLLVLELALRTFWNSRMKSCLPQGCELIAWQHQFSLIQ